MQRFTKTIAAIMLITVVFYIVGCTKPDEPSNGTENNGGGHYDGNYEYVDLGLPSGTLWATFNVGANVPEGYGDYFAWGEVQPKEVYNLSTYKYCKGSHSSYTKYCYDSGDGYNGYSDTLTIILAEDDAATVNWGEEWRTPTKEEWEELASNCAQIWTQQNGVNGFLLTANNGRSIFLPAAGCYSSSGLKYVGNRGGYWSSSLGLPDSAFDFNFYSGGYELYHFYREVGRSVRGVRSRP